VRVLLAVYTLLNAGLYIFDAIRYGVGSYDWISLGISALIIALLWRGSRGAWLLSFLGSALGFIVFLANASDGDSLAGSLAATAFFGAQVGILLTPQMRRFVRETATTERSGPTAAGNHLAHGEAVQSFGTFLNDLD